LGGAGQSIVREIDRDVVDLIKRAEDDGGNSTSGGIVKFGSSLPATNFQSVLFKVIIPPLALANGAGWQPRGSAEWIYDTTNWYYTTNSILERTLILDFKPAAGYVTAPAYQTNLQNSIAGNP